MLPIFYFLFDPFSLRIIVTGKKWVFLKLSTLNKNLDTKLKDVNFFCFFVHF